MKYKQTEKTHYKFSKKKKKSEYKTQPHYVTQLLYLLHISVFLFPKWGMLQIDQDIFFLILVHIYFPNWS